jgi:preprotein translocase subunit SecY
MLETLKNAWKIEEIRKKIIFTLIVLVIFRVGSAIPVPFLDPGALKSMLSSESGAGNLLGYIDILSGGSFAQSTLFALSISPYITASIVMQLLTVAIPYLERLAKDGGEEGKKKIDKITRYMVVALALLQATAYCVMLRNMNAVSYRSGWEGWFTAFVIIFTFTAGALLIVFLGEQIDRRGIGNGISIILFTGIVSRGTSLISTVYAYLQQAVAGKTQYFFSLPVMLAVFVVLIAFIVVMTNAERRIPVQYAKRVVGRKMYGGQSTFIPIKVNMSGVLPVIFASTLLAIPGTIKGFTNLDVNSWLYKFLNAFNYNTFMYAALYFMLIMVQYNAVEIANNIRKNSGTVPGIRPGKPTSDFIAKVVSKTTFLGGIFLAIVAILPIGLGALTEINIALGGTSVIILVGVALDTVRQLESQMMMRHYKGFLE